MRQLLVVALMVGVGAAPACAQHGGGGHGGGSGGFHGGGGGFVSHGGFAAPRGYAAQGGYGRSASRGSADGAGYAPRYTGGRGVGMATARPEFYRRDGDRRRGYRVPYGYGYGVGIGYTDYGWLDANDPDDAEYDPGYEGGYDPGYGQDGGYDMAAYPDGPGVIADGYAVQDGSYAEGSPDNGQPAPYAAGTQPSAAVETPRVVRPSPVRRQPSLYDDESVTLIFKDGRAPEKIYNYALTRTTLYVTDGRRREIPVTDLDLAATEKANRAAGVRFQLPVTQ